MENPNDNILEKVKILLKIPDDAQDDIIKLYIGIAVQDALNHTNRSKLPVELEFTIVRMVRLAMSGIQPGSADLKNMTVASVSEAGRSVSFATAQLTEQFVGGEKKEILNQLNKFKLPYRG